MFLDLTPAEFYTSLWEKEQHEEDVVIAQVRIVCETIRLQTAHLINIQTGKGHKIRNVKKLMRFQWEQEVQPAQTKEEMIGMMKMIAKGLPNKKKNDASNRRRSIRR